MTETLNIILTVLKIVGIAWVCAALGALIWIIIVIIADKRSK